MTYTGYTFEELLEGMDSRKAGKELLEATQILVDGRFEIKRKNLLLKFRGSENQRVLDVPESLRRGAAVEKEL